MKSLLIAVFAFALLAMAGCTA